MQFPPMNLEKRSLFSNTVKFIQIKHVFLQKFFNEDPEHLNGGCRPAAAVHPGFDNVAKGVTTFPLLLCVRIFFPSNDGVPDRAL